MDATIQLNVQRVDYDALPYWNQTVVKRWLEYGSLPSKFKYWHDQRREEKPSEACLLGSAVDCSVLEHAEFGNRFVVVPKCDRRTKEGKESWKAFEQTANGRQLLTADQSLTIEHMDTAVRCNASTYDVFANCTKAVITADLFGLPCKGEIDLWEDKTEHIWDLKALKDVSDKGFASAFFDSKYYIQATFYMELARAAGIKKNVFNFICVENTPPHSVQVHSFSPLEDELHGVIQHHALRQIKNSLEELHRRFTEDDFRDDQEWKLIEIPAWRERQLAV